MVEAGEDNEISLLVKVFILDELIHCDSLITSVLDLRPVAVGATVREGVGAQSTPSPHGGAYRHRLYTQSQTALGLTSSPSYAGGRWGGKSHLPVQTHGKIVLK